MSNAIGKYSSGAIQRDPTDRKQQWQSEAAILETANNANILVFVRCRAATVGLLDRIALNYAPLHSGY